MIRTIWCLPLVLLAGTALRAGEMDAEFGPAAPPDPVALVKRIPPGEVLAAPLPRDHAPLVLRTSELDAETPSQAWGWGRGFGWGGWGWGRGLGWGGWGWGRGLGWGGWGWGGWGWGGLGWGGPGWGGWGWGWSPFISFSYVGFPGWCYW